MPMQTMPFKLDVNRSAPLEFEFDNSNSKESESNTQNGRTTNNVKNQQTTKAYPRASNIQTHGINKKNTKTASRGGLGKSRGNEKKQTADKSDQKRRV